VSVHVQRDIVEDEVGGAVVCVGLGAGELQGDLLADESVEREGGRSYRLSASRLL
jgi:hypothetical protein